MMGLCELCEYNYALYHYRGLDLCIGCYGIVKKNDEEVMRRYENERNERDEQP